MGLGILALALAIGAAALLLYRAARPAGASEQSNVDWLKGVIFLALAAALFAAKLWPLAFMTLVAAGGVTAIEIWRKREIARDDAASVPAARSGGPMTVEEAASVLGLAGDAGEADIRAAHKKLIGQLHPDKGGSDYLASKINEARDCLLKQRALEAAPPPDV